MSIDTHRRYVPDAALALSAVPRLGAAQANGRKVHVGLPSGEM